ncbi:hypothetical protein [Streptomyces canus]|uniref:hypothetical protein n=1 Tax=Streptomyces canus TaxID=58343 RepID=UPI002E2E6DCD|nr:hypothetical protein [Streptomyces canus]
MSGPTRRRTARMLVSVPPIRFGSMGVVGWPAKWVLDFFVRGGAAHFDQAAQHGPGAGHHGGDGVEQHPLLPALPQVLAAQALRARPGHQSWYVRPTALHGSGLRP